MSGVALAQPPAAVPSRISPEPEHSEELSQQQPQPTKDSMESQSAKDGNAGDGAVNGHVDGAAGAAGAGAAASGTPSTSTSTSSAPNSGTSSSSLSRPGPRLAIPIMRRPTTITEQYIAQQEEREGAKAATATTNEAFATLRAARKDPAAALVMPPAPVGGQPLSPTLAGPIKEKEREKDSLGSTTSMATVTREGSGSKESLVGPALANANPPSRPSTPSGALVPPTKPSGAGHSPPPPPTTHVRLPPSVRSSPLPRSLPPLSLEDYDIDPVTGFVPSNPPLLERLPAYYEPWEKLVDILTGPKEVIRRIVDEELPILRTDALRTRREWQRAYTALAYIVHAYVWGDVGYESRNYLPPQLSLPFIRVSQSLGLRPSLSMYSANHFNWYLIDKTKPISLDNIWTSISFTDLEDEAWFNLISIAIEFKGAEILPEIIAQCSGNGPTDAAELERVLRKLAHTIDEMVNLLGRMRERCRPEMFWKGFRRFLAGWEGVNNGRGMFYEGVKFIGKLEGEIDAEDFTSSLEVSRGVKQAPIQPRGIGENGKMTAIPKMTRGVESEETHVAPVEEGPRAAAMKDSLKIPKTVDADKSASSASSEEDDEGRRTKKVMGLTVKGDAIINKEVVMGVYGKFGGATAAQSPTIQAMDIFLGVEHRPTGMKNSQADPKTAHAYVSPLSSAVHPPQSTEQPHTDLETTKPLPPPPSKVKAKNFLLEMRNQMPTQTRLFLRDFTLRCRGTSADGSSPGMIRAFVLAHPDNKSLAEAYDMACDAMKRFRERHMGLAHSYIAVMARLEGKAGGSGSVGTGGSEMMPFLKQSKQETVERMVLGEVKRPGKAEDEFE